MSAQAPLLISRPEYAYLAKELAAVGSFELGQLECDRFPDGEQYQRILSPVAKRDVVLLGGTISEESTLAIYDLACAIVKYGAERLTLMIPYFGYSTMERAVKPQEVVAAKTRARLFSFVPPASHGNRVVLLDLHNEGIPYYFEGGITAIHAYAHPIIVKAAQELGGQNFVLGSSDAGRAKWVQSLANTMGVDKAFIFKKRIDGQTTEVTAVSGEVKGKDVIIYDDIIRTGGSLIGAATAYRNAGAKKISAICTHGVFAGDALKRLGDCGLFSNIVATDSHPRAVAAAGPALDVRSVASVLAPILSPSTSA